MAQYLSALRPQSVNNTLAAPPIIGATTPNSGFFTSVSVEQLKLNVKNTSQNHTVTNQDSVVLCDASTTSLSITLPNPSECTGRTIAIKKVDTSSNPVALIPISGFVDGAATHTIFYPMQSVYVISDGSNYFVL